jgi:hypothetical protein
MISLFEKKIPPQPGQIVRVRTRTYLTESVETSSLSHNDTSIRLACLDDDAQGEILEVVWELELDAEIVDKDSVWKSIGKKGFDTPRYFGAYLHTLRWNCVTATDPKLFQSPFRAGIKIDAYQLEPLRKALALPRVNLFIADDVGLGKTIEATLIASELMLRRRVREVVVVCPPAMLEQWKGELDARFGMTFEILDRQYVQRIRQERGYGVNPWTSFPRFLVSQRLLIDEEYAAPLRDWLGNLRPGTLLIFDEAHHAAPSSGAKYAIDSRITRAVREIAPRFEHKLFLSATPHNGHSNSFSALLELLDSHRFTRGVKVRKSQLDDVMVRRLKEDIRSIAGGFAKRVPVQIDIDGLPEDAPELKLSKLLNEYRGIRQNRIAGATKRKQTETMLLFSGLQQRLLSSIEAFARTLNVHRKTMERIWAGEKAEIPKPEMILDPDLLAGTLDSNDDRSQLSEAELEALQDETIESVTKATAGDMAHAGIARERTLLNDMVNVADSARCLPDARVKELIIWIQKKMCAGVRVPGISNHQKSGLWNDTRLLIFTEYDDTRRYLENMLKSSVEDTDCADLRIAVFHGPTPPDKREIIKRAFNTPPTEHPLRILIATDAAREGLNLQAHCYNLFHFDLPWNPSRLEQRNGRIDRKLQPSPIVYCHYFIYKQRAEDPVLQALVRKTDVIRKQLGSLAQVLESRLADTLKTGISHIDAARIELEINKADLDSEKKEVVEEELESSRKRQDDLRRDIDSLRTRISAAQKWIGLDIGALKDAISCSLEMMGAEPLNKPAANTTIAVDQFQFPNLGVRFGSDPTWATTLDTLRKPPEDGIRNFQWRKDAPIRPVVFSAPDEINENVVQLHLHHRIVQRLLGRFVSQGFVHFDLSRACLAQSRDAIPRVILLGRLSLYGKGAVRLHEEMLTVASRWLDPADRKKPLSPFARDGEASTLELLEKAIEPGAGSNLPEKIKQRLLDSMSHDIEDLLPHLEKRGQEGKTEAEEKLKLRGITESEAMRSILKDQRRRVLAEAGKTDDALQLDLFSDMERRQIDSNRRYWQRWLAHVENDIVSEPARILDFYSVSSFRIEPIGIAYLWPVTG